jgi:hypothetical protein
MTQYDDTQHDETQFPLVCHILLFYAERRYTEYSGALLRPVCCTKAEASPILRMNVRSL